MIACIWLWLTLILRMDTKCERILCCSCHHYPKRSHLIHFIRPYLCLWCLFVCSFGILIGHYTTAAIPIKLSEQFLRVIVCSVAANWTNWTETERKKKRKPIDQWRQLAIPWRMCHEEPFSFEEKKKQKSNWSNAVKNISMLHSRLKNLTLALEDPEFMARKCCCCHVARSVHISYMHSIFIDCDAFFFFSTFIIFVGFISRCRGRERARAHREHTNFYVHLILIYLYAEPALWRRATSIHVGNTI